MRYDLSTTREEHQVTKREEPRYTPYKRRAAMAQLEKHSSPELERNPHTISGEEPHHTATIAENPGTMQLERRNHKQRCIQLPQLGSGPPLELEKGLLGKSILETP